MVRHGKGRRGQRCAHGGCISGVDMDYSGPYCPFHRYLIRALLRQGANKDIAAAHMIARKKMRNRRRTV